MFLNSVANICESTVAQWVEKEALLKDPFAFDKALYPRVVVAAHFAADYAEDNDNEDDKT